MELKRRFVAGALMVLALGGIGAGVASAATPAATGVATTAQPAALVDTPEAGDAADPAGSLDTPEPADSADPAGSVDTDNLQQGDQSGPDGPDTPSPAGR